MATTVRVSETTRARAASIAAATGLSIGEVVDHALDAYEVAAFWREAREALAGQAQPADEWGERPLRDGLLDE